MIRFQCPACGKAFKAKSEMAGRKGNCNKCGHEVAVPAHRRVSGKRKEVPVALPYKPPPLPKCAPGSNKSDSGLTVPDDQHVSAEQAPPPPRAESASRTDRSDSDISVPDDEHVSDEQVSLPPHEESASRTERSAFWKRVRRKLFGKRVIERPGWVLCPSDIKSYFQAEAESNEMRVPARIRDISSAGTWMLIGQRFAPGTVLRIQLEKRSGGHSRPISARVTRAAYHAGYAQWLLRCVFSTKLSPEELHSLLTTKKR